MTKLKIKTGDNVTVIAGDHKGSEGKVLQVLIDKNKEENQKLSGKVIWISESAEFTPKIIQTKEERTSLVYAVKVKVENDGRIKIGMPGEINFMANE